MQSYLNYTNSERYSKECLSEQSHIVDIFSLECYMHYVYIIPNRTIVLSKEPQITYIIFVSFQKEVNITTVNAFILARKA